MVSALLQHGPGYLALVLRDVERWFEAHGYASLGDAHGTMSLAQSRNPAAIERGNYTRVLQAWRLNGVGR
jgi:hypothetical protein